MISNVTDSLEVFSSFHKIIEIYLITLRSFQPILPRVRSKGPQIFFKISPFVCIHMRSKF